MAKDNLTVNWNNKYHYGIPDKDYQEVKERDTRCVYCDKKMYESKDSKDKRNWRTVEHLNYNPDWDSVRSFVEAGKSTTPIIAMCCFSCNASRGKKQILDWFEGKYCKDKKIYISTVSNVVKDFLKNKNEYENIFKTCPIKNNIK